MHARVQARRGLREDVRTLEMKPCELRVALLDCKSCLGELGLDVGTKKCGASHTETVGNDGGTRLNDSVAAMVNRGDACEARARVTKPAWRGRIFLDAGAILYVGPGSTADLHAHHAVQLVWSLDGTFDLAIGEQRVQRTATLIPANSPHTLDAVGSTIALLLVEPHGSRGVALDQVARHDVGRELASDLASLVFPAPDASPRQALAWCDDVLAALGVAATRPALSSVSRRAIERVERTIDGVPRVSDVATAVGLSSTRVTHIFSQEVGIPFRRFVLWTRIKRAVTAFQAGHDLSASAIAAGFSDAAHFSRTFRSMFGLSPSLVLPLAEVSGAIWT